EFVAPLKQRHLSQRLKPYNRLFEVSAPSPFGRGLGRRFVRLSFAPSPARARITCSTFLVRRTSSSDIEPRSHPDVFDREHQPQEKLDGHRQQHTYSKELKRHVLQDAGLSQQL